MRDRFARVPRGASGLPVALPPKRGVLRFRRFLAMDRHGPLGSLCRRFCQCHIYPCHGVLLGHEWLSVRAGDLQMRNPERHRTHRMGWLRAAVLGANDGIVSTASLIVAWPPPPPTGAAF